MAKEDGSPKGQTTRMVGMATKDQILKGFIPKREEMPGNPPPKGARTIHLRGMLRNSHHGHREESRIDA